MRHLVLHKGRRRGVGPLRGRAQARHYRSVNSEFHEPRPTELRITRRVNINVSHENDTAFSIRLF
jgi:ribosomal protein L19E